MTGGTKEFITIEIMNKLGNKILSIILIPIVLFSTLSFNIDRHICMDNLFSISLLGAAEDCGMEIGLCDEDMIMSDQVSNEDCCDDENQYISGSIFNQNEGINFDTGQRQFFTYFIISKYYLFKSNLNKPFHIKFYSPPTVIKKISVLFQIFII